MGFSRLSHGLCCSLEMSSQPGFSRSAVYELDVIRVGWLALESSPVNLR